MPAFGPDVQGRLSTKRMTRCARVRPRFSHGCGPNDGGSRPAEARLMFSFGSVPRDPLGCSQIGPTIISTSGRSAVLIAYIFLMPPPGGRFVNVRYYSNSGQIRLRLDVLCADSGYGIASRQPAINRTSARCLHHPFAKTGNVSFTRLQRRLHRPVPHQSRTLQWDQPQMRNCTCGQHGPNSRWPT